MNFRSLIARSIVLATFLAAPAVAQEKVHVQLTSPTVPGSNPVIWSPSGYSSFYVSPYSGILMSQGNQPVILNCVDFFHDVSINQDWWAYKTVLSSGDLSLTRFNNLTWYLEAAYLTQQYGANPGSTPYQTIAIQAAIWDIFADGTPTKTDGTGKTSQAYWAGAAFDNWQTINASQFYVLTATNKDDPHSVQEFLVYDKTVATPEPATLTLLGTGLAGIAAVRRRRNRRRSESETN
jgi:hypothetical protein